MVVVLVVAVVAAVAEAKTEVPPMMPCSEMSMEEETSEKVRRPVRIIGGCAPARKKIGEGELSNFWMNLLSCCVVASRITSALTHLTSVYP